MRAGIDVKSVLLFSKPRLVAVGTPFFLLPDPIAGFDQQTVSIHARQSTIGAAFTGPEFRGWQSGGLAVAMFYNDAEIVDRYAFLPRPADPVSAWDSPE